VERPSTLPYRFGGNIGSEGYRPRRLKGDEVGNGSHGGRTAEGTVLEIGVALGLVMMEMVGRSAAVRRAELQQ
jgi:hypothetical protein